MIFEVSVSQLQPAARTKAVVSRSGGILGILNRASRFKYPCKQPVLPQVQGFIVYQLPCCLPFPVRLATLRNDDRS
jgi:hypothetical protein